MTYSLHKGDCIDVLANAPAESVDLVLTDPPYLCNYKDRSGRTVANDNNRDWINPAFKQIARVMKDDTICISFYGWGSVDRFFSAWREAGLSPVGHIVWAKDYASKKGFLQSQHEQAYVLAKGRPEKPTMPLPDVRTWKYTGNRLHPTQKDVSVLTPLIEAFSRPAQVVLDPFMGSGSTGAAAAMTKRRFIGIEMNETHFATASERVAKLYPLRSTASYSVL